MAAALFATDYWPETASTVTFVPSNTAPDLPVTAVRMYAFEAKAVLLARVGRGWDFPGGHVEPHETPAMALMRELKEETGATVQRYRLIGYLDIRNSGETKRSRTYPKASCILIYTGAGLTFDSAHDTTRFEATDQKLVPLERVPTYHHAWSELSEQILTYAHDHTA